MRKYLHIYKSTLIENLSYIPNIALGFVQFFLIMFILANLWQYIYSDSNQIINGYTINQMMWYILTTETLWYGIKSKVITKEISQDIRSGNIAYKVNKPYNYIFYVIAKYFGEITIRFILHIIVAVIIGISFIGEIPNFNFINIPLILVTTLLRYKYRCHNKNYY